MVNFTPRFLALALLVSVVSVSAETSSSPAANVDEAADEYHPSFLLSHPSDGELKKRQAGGYLGGGADFGLGLDLGHGAGVGGGPFYNNGGLYRRSEEHLEKRTLGGAYGGAGADFDAGAGAGVGAQVGINLNAGVGAGVGGGVDGYPACYDGGWACNGGGPGYYRAGPTYFGPAPGYYAGGPVYWGGHAPYWNGGKFRANYYYHNHGDRVHEKVKYSYKDRRSLSEADEEQQSYENEQEAA